MADPRPAGRPDPRPPVQAVGGTRHPGRGPILSFTGEGQDQVPGAWAQRCGPGRLCETPVMAVDEAPRARSTRMTGRERREQLVSVGRQVFAEKGYDMASVEEIDRKSTRLNSSHVAISYAVFCLKRKSRRRAGGGS